MSEQSRIGEFKRCSVSDEVYHTYLPKPLPPNPPVVLNKLYPLIDKANNLLGQLESMGRVLPDHRLFLYMYIRKEAVLSSQIEGTQSSLSDLLQFENMQKETAAASDVTDISHYVAAMEYGLERLTQEFPLCLRLLREMHAILLQEGRGAEKSPGEFRRSQNWIGGTRPGNARFVPPPPEALADLLGDLEQFLHDKSLPVIVKAALVHLQFETIHPFLDGNGRLGRLLITLLLCQDKLLSKPLLYLSVYFKSHRQLYYQHLQQVRESGDWESWIAFFLAGVITTAQEAINTMQALEALFQTDRHKILSLGKARVAMMTVYQYVQQHPIVDAKLIAKECAITLPTALKVLATLEELGIVRETSGRKRNKIYEYEAYLALLENGKI